MEGEITTNEGSVKGNYTGTIVLFEDFNFNGDALILENSGGEKNLKTLKYNDKMSSFIIQRGLWRFYDDVDWKKQMGKDCGPGIYRDCTSGQAGGMRKGKLSSLECIGP